MTSGKGQTVEMRNNCYSPTVLHAPLGEAVTFVNRDEAPHTVTGAGEWGTGQKEVFGGQSFHLRFQEPGLYLYACTIHPGMVGAVYVGSGPEIDVANSTAVTPPTDDADSDEASSESAAAQGFEAEAASTSEGALGGSTGLIVVLSVVALGAGYGLGRLRRRISKGTAG